MTEATLPDVPEAEAYGEVATLYERIRAESGSALVNYIWRHLATIPGGAASWCWEVATANDTLPTQRAIKKVATLEAEAISRKSRATVSLGADAENILTAYNFNNPANLARVNLLLEALRALSEGSSSQTTRPSVTKEEVAASPRGEVLPSLPAISALSETDLSAVRRLAKAGPAAASGLTPSLWRHLSTQPELLPELVGPLETVLHSVEFADALSRLQNAAAPVQRPWFPPEKPEFNSCEVQRSLSAFSMRISELTLTGHLLAEWCSKEDMPNGVRLK